jgi:hypothetical protein
MAQEEVRTVSKLPVSFRQRDLQRALRAAKGVGLEVKHFEIDPASGKITVSMAEVGEAKNDSSLDRWLAKNAHQA